MAFTAQYLLLGNVSVFVSTTLALLSIVVMRAAVVDSLIGSTLIWHEGEWFIAHGNKQTAVVLLAGSLRLPWIVYLGVRETHARRSWRFFLFSDSVNTEQLRRLRCRIVLTE